MLLYRTVNMIVEDFAIGAGGLGLIPEPVKFDSVAIGSPPLSRFCVGQALNRVDVPATISYFGIIQRV